MLSLKKEVRKAIMKGTAESFDYEIVQYFESHPTGVGFTIMHFHPITISGDMSQSIIAKFDTGTPALMQLGPDGSKAGYSYPYNKVTGTFIPFNGNYELQEWAAKNVRNLKDSAAGIFVGKKSTTRFGKRYNRWVDLAGKNLKSQSNTRSTILKYLRAMKLTY